jgi:hypothetical protein
MTGSSFQIFGTAAENLQRQQPFVKEVQLANVLSTNVSYFINGVLLKYQTCMLTGEKRAP